ncbi:MAG TPA: protein-methionine-sulfoxide reductase catalytic subunit MsrP [Thermoanaerobaculia bacterium]|nr:protein-methionine-sulfoxide reductase catalytic subunit MsrP [Thermoanaerobaculia bacterium]
MAHLRIPRPWEIPEWQATPEAVFLNRRQLLAALGLGAVSLGLPVQIAGAAPVAPKGDPAKMLQPAVGSRFRDRFPAKRNPAYRFGGRPLTPEEKAARYNNFYEFTPTKNEVWPLAAGYPVTAWKVEVAGLVGKPRTYDLDDLFRFPLEERLYRHRCVERWAMQVPWTGFPLRRLLDAAQPLSTAKYVRFVSFSDPEHLPGMKETVSYYPWPYHEGLRFDEARHDLAFVVLGSYGHPLPMQHGAPLRIHCPWKYGYKSPKSIVKIELVADAPPTFWHALQPAEYGFYSNVNPKKPHPRWSQEIEEDLGTGERRATQLYNGYGPQVAGLYKGDEA